MRKYWPLLALLLVVVLVIPAFAQEVPACQVQAVQGTFVNDLLVSGKVGIGLAEGVVPTTQLEVGGTIIGKEFCIGSIENCISSWPTGGGELTGTGTANAIAKWIGANQIENSVIFEKTVNNEQFIGIGTATPSEKLEVAGKIKATILKGNTICLVADDGTEDCRQAWPAGGGGLTGGTVGTLAKWAADSSLEDSIAAETTNANGAGVLNINGQLATTGGFRSEGGIITSGDILAIGSVEAQNGLTVNNQICLNGVCRQAWPAGGGSDACSVNVFAGVTDVTNNGNAGGYSAANDICGAKIAGSHVCTSEEILKTINCNSDMSAAGDNWGWVSGGPPGFTASANDCEGWTTNAGGSYGRFWNFVDNKGSLTSCNSDLRFACCK